MRMHSCCAWPVAALQADPESRAIATLAARIHDQYITPIQVGLWLPLRHVACAVLSINITTSPVWITFVPVMGCSSAVMRANLHTSMLPVTCL
jgi:hypothetical protein